MSATSSPADYSNILEKIMSYIPLTNYGLKHTKFVPPTAMALFSAIALKSSPSWTPAPSVAAIWVWFLDWHDFGWKFSLNWICLRLCVQTLLYAISEEYGGVHIYTYDKLP